MLLLHCLEKLKSHLERTNGFDSWHIRVQQPMAEEDIWQGIEHVGSAIVVAVDIAETVIAQVVEFEVDAEADSETVSATAVVVVVVVEAVNGDEVEAETVNVAGADIAHYVGALVDEGYMEGVGSATATAGVLIGPVDDAAPVQIHNVHAIVEVREGWQVGIDTCVVEVKEGWQVGVDTCVVEAAGFETLTQIEAEPKGLHNCCMANFQDMLGGYKNNFLCWMEQASDDACRLGQRLMMVHMLLLVEKMVSVTK